MVKEFLTSHQGDFAFTSFNLPDIYPSIIPLTQCQFLIPVQQKKCFFPLQRQQANNKEVDKLIKANFIREVDYPSWLPNVVLMKKGNGKWRLYIDFTDLNKDCPKDCFPLPFIDKLLDATAGYEYLPSLDALLGYHQTPMNHKNKEKIAFIIENGIYYYTIIPFRLKDTGATYQWPCWLNF